MNDSESKNIKLLHNVCLGIIEEFVKICDEEKLTYYLSGGTLLGAVRHKGFIPWDDDADFSMPRDDYEKFLKIAPRKLSGKYKLINFKTDENYQYYITRIQDIETSLIETRINNDNKFTHASIDIFPLDGTPNNRFLRKIYFLKVMIHRAMMSLSYKDSIDPDRKRSLKEKILLNTMLILPTNILFNGNKEKYKIDKMMRKYKINESENIGCLMGAYRTNQIVPKRFFGTGRYYEFENLYLRGPELYDDYLKQMYGDYMKIPSKDNIKIHYKIVEINGHKVEEDV